tara:strand:+ start:322 stop:627 length:306 start_codon:yes stop_codon:yes gene_type:complete
MSSESNHTTYREFAIVVQGKQTVAIQELDVCAFVIIHKIRDDSDGDKLSVPSIHQVNVANAAIDGESVKCSVSFVVCQGCYLLVGHEKTQPVLTGSVGLGI